MVSKNFDSKFNSLRPRYCWTRTFFLNRRWAWILVWPLNNCWSFSTLVINTCVLLPCYNYFYTLEISTWQEYHLDSVPIKYSTAISLKLLYLLLKRVTKPVHWMIVHCEFDFRYRYILDVCSLVSYLRHWFTQSDILHASKVTE